MTEHADAEKAAEEWATLSVGEVPADRIMAPFSYLTLWKRDKKMLKEGFLAGAAWGAPKWISVKERMPDVDRGVILCGSRGLFFGWLSSEESELPKFFDFDNEICGVTHWMPLPAAPKEEK